MAPAVRSVSAGKVRIVEAPSANKIQYEAALAELATLGDATGPALAATRRAQTTVMLTLEANHRDGQDLRKELAAHCAAEDEKNASKKMEAAQMWAKTVPAKEAVDASDARVEETEATLEETKAKIAARFAEGAALAEKSSAMDARIKEVAQLKKQARRDIDALRLEKEAKASDLDGLKAARDGAVAELDGTQASYTQRLAGLQDLQRKIDELKQTHAKARAH
jgi:chromosome segregation ATPase